MNILIITSLYPGYEDQPRSEVPYAIHNFAKEWNKKGNNVKVIRLWTYYPSVFGFNSEIVKKSNSEGHFTIEGVDVYRYPILRIPKYKYVTRKIKTVSNKIFNDITSSYIPDVIVCHILDPAIIIANNIVSKIKIPTVVVLHNSDIDYLKKRRNFKKYNNLKGIINKIGFRSERIKKEYLALFNGDSENKEFFIVQSGINSNDIISKDILREKLIHNSRTIVVACNLIKLKNVDTVIYAFSKLKMRENYKLFIFGDGIERKELEKIVNDLKIEHLVYFMGEQPRNIVLKYMEQADIFAMVSSPETFGLVYLEAMAKGCITIGSKGEGIDGIIVDGFNGFLSQPKSVDMLVEIFNKITSMDYKMRLKVVINARETVSNMTEEVIAEKYLSEVSELF
ncbi:hypothetical protein BME96_16090 [Virgibacillus halodenitrificans]|uniref:Glycosyl transferase family 1 domain-containing protein n=1 Tax=Virgibacillus halodenitrificans TaxID=1482 RepID=A0AAC9J1P9_VIRHA|nr:glycosyltransferase [Virgibacillus halodenitrificans]APC49618.1 hypothetical protein BME96_16090 [Virgibacillus halodenitrificans]